MPECCVPNELHPRQHPVHHTHTYTQTRTPTNTHPNKHTHACTHTHIHTYTRISAPQTTSINVLSFITGVIAISSADGADGFDEKCRCKPFAEPSTRAPAAAAAAAAITTAANYPAQVAATTHRALRAADSTHHTDALPATVIFQAFDFDVSQRITQDEMVWLALASLCVAATISPRSRPVCVT